jgi:hypothetical protein
MAKGTNTVALFDVVRKSSPLPRRSWNWPNPFKWLRARWASSRVAWGAPAGAVAAPIAAPVVAPPVAPPVAAASAALGSATADRAEGIAFSIDRARREISIRMSYWSTAVCVLAVFVLGGVCYLLGRQSGGVSRPVLASETVSEIRARPPQANVLSPSRSEVPGGGERASADSGVAPAPEGARQTAPVGPATQPATFTIDDPRRQGGLNYIVVQSYPTKEMADEIVNLLKRNSISATVERGLKGWGPQWYCVVGTKGFARISSQEFRDGVAQIKAISSANLSRRSFKAFEPLAYKWGQ